MANGVLHYVKASVDHYADPQNFIMLLSVVSLLAGRSATLLGKDLSKIANFGKIATLASSLFIFWNLGDLVKKPWGAATDVKTYLWDHLKIGTTPQVIREGRLGLRGAADTPPINEDFPKRYNPTLWIAERVVSAALKTFATYTIVYAALNAIGAVKSAPSARLNLCGAIASISVCAIGIFEQRRKYYEGPIESKLEDDANLDRYKVLHKRNCAADGLKTSAFIGIYLVSLIGALSAIYGKGSLFGRVVGRVSGWSGDLYLAGFTLFEGLNYAQALSSGAEMKKLEKN